MIRIEHLSFTYGGTPTPALRDITMEIPDGQFVLITGPSGGGKSSLCRCLNGLIPHFYGGRLGGTIEVQGMDTTRHPVRELALKVGMVFQDPENQLVSMDVEREIAFSLENLGFPRNLIARRIEEALDTIGIAHLRRRPIHELSGGEKQKVVIASVLALHPEVLALDEPTSELDPKGAEEVLSTVQRLNDELGITVILIEHRLDRVVHLVDRVIVVHEGRIAADGPPREVLNMPAIPALGIGLPPIVRLARGLSGEHVDASRLPLTVKEARFLLDPVVTGPPATPLSWPPRHNGSPPVVTFDRLCHTYEPGCAALKNVDLGFAGGEFVAIMGRNASGKTTLAKHTNGLLKPTRGRVTVAGADTRQASVAHLARTVGFSFQNPNDHLFADTVEGEIAFTLRHMGIRGDKLKSRVNSTLEKFHLQEYRCRYPRSLSGGQRQRVALASVVAAEPKVLVLDEPTRGMDHRLKHELMMFLDEYRRSGKTVILITHDVETVAEHADRVVLMSEGGVVVDAPTREALSGALLFSPQINRLLQSFAARGIPGDVLTVEEALDLLR